MFNSLNINSTTNMKLCYTIPLIFATTIANYLNFCYQKKNMAIPTLDDIKDYNPWMNNKNFDVPKFKRNYYERIFKTVKRRKFIVAITGLRRIGKTVMLKQIGNQLDGDKYFFSFEEDRFANYDSLKFVINKFISWSNKPFIFLDEIGRVKNWAGLIKKYHDLGKARFIISGSSSLTITKGKESLAGRLIEYQLSTWEFDEYLKLRGYKVKMYNLNNIEKTYLEWNHKFEDEVRPFLIKGGFPELIDETDEKLIKKYISSTTIERIIFEDIPKIFNIKNSNLLDNIMTYICKNTGSIVRPFHLSDAFDVSKDTIKDYLYFLKYAYLVDFLTVEGGSLKGFRRSKKIYATSSSIAYSMMDYYDEPKLVENTIFNKLKTDFDKLWFYRDSQGHEVDFTGNITVESKWKSKITINDLKPLIYYLKKKKKKKAYVVGKYFDIIKKDKITIYVVPLPLFLLIKF